MPPPGLNKTPLNLTRLQDLAAKRSVVAFVIPSVAVAAAAANLLNCCGCLLLRRFNADLLVCGTVLPPLAGAAALSLAGAPLAAALSLADAPLAAAL